MDVQRVIDKEEMSSEDNSIAVSDFLNYFIVWPCKLLFVTPEVAA